MKKTPDLNLKGLLRTAARYRIGRSEDRNTRRSEPALARPEDLAIALLAACDGELRRTLLAEVGMLEADLDSVDAVARGDGGEGTAVSASKVLAEILNGCCAKLWRGEDDPANAFRTLVKDPKVIEGMRALLFRAANGKAGEEEPDRLLFWAFQEGYRLGQLHFGLSNDFPVSNFALGQSEDAFAQVLRQYVPRRDAALLAIYTKPVHPRWGWYPQTLRRRGPVTANLLLATRVHELCPFSREAPWLSLREIALCVRPEDPHNYLPSLCEAATGCFERYELERLPLTMVDVEGLHSATPSTRVRPTGW